MAVYEGLGKGTIKTGKVRFRQLFLIFFRQTGFMLSDSLPGQPYTIDERMFPCSQGVWKA